MDEYEFYKKETGELVTTEHYLKDFYLKINFVLLPRNKILKKIYFFFHRNFLIKIIILFKFSINCKFYFKSPKKVKTIVFDSTGLELIRDILEIDQYFVLDIRIQKFKFIYITKNILKNFIFNFFKYSLKMNYIISIVDPLIFQYYNNDHH